MVLTYTPLRRQQHNTIKANDYVLGLMSMQRLLYLLERMKEKRIRREKKTNEKTSDRMQKEKRKIDGPPLTSFCLCHDTLYISLIFFLTRVRALLSFFPSFMYPTVLSTII